MKCFHCHKEILEDGGILISPDGDFVCNDECKRGYEKERDYFFDVIIYDDAKMEAWLLG